jgi:hypothetical protein
MKTYFIAAVAALGIFTQSLSANVLEDFVGSWKFRAGMYVDGWKLANITGTMRVTKLGKNSFLAVTTLNAKAITGESATATDYSWMFPNRKTAGFSTMEGETNSVSSGTWRVSGNKIIFTETTYSPGEKPSSSSITYTRKNKKQFDISGSGGGPKVKGSITK